ncbi:MAG: cytochrome c, partial [Bdellovibrionales bacterium]|nr:cytochrome c [Bdellovibrionales bacterium]
QHLDDLNVVEKELKNPLAGNMSKEVLLTGQKYYVTNCAVCHGNKGEGGVAANAPATQLMALKPPVIDGEKISGWTDAHIYFVISKGQGLMGAYNHHIPQEYRWQVVNYIRHLQQEAKK